MIPIPWILAGATALLGAGGTVYALSASQTAIEEDNEPPDTVADMPVRDAEELAIRTIQRLAQSSPGCGILASQWLTLWEVHAQKEAAGKGGFLGASRANRLSRLGRLAREVATCAGEVDLRRFGWERIGSFLQATASAAADAAKVYTSVKGAG